MRTLYVSKKPRGLREIADLTELSLAGVQDILRRLEEAGIISSAMNKNKREFSLVLTKQEEKLLRQAIELDTKNKLTARAKKISLRSKAAISWIDETHKSIKIAKLRTS